MYISNVSVYPTSESHLKEKLFHLCANNLLNLFTETQGEATSGERARKLLIKDRAKAERVGLAKQGVAG